MMQVGVLSSPLAPVLTVIALPPTNRSSKPHDPARSAGSSTSSSGTVSGSNSIYTSTAHGNPSFAKVNVPAIVVVYLQASRSK
jgi:hypothetical protein